MYVCHVEVEFDGKRVADASTEDVAIGAVGARAVDGCDIAGHIATIKITPTAMNTTAETTKRFIMKFREKRGKASTGLLSV